MSSVAPDDDTLNRLISETTSLKVSVSVLEGYQATVFRSVRDLDTKLDALAKRFAPAGLQPLCYGHLIRLVNDEYRDELHSHADKYAGGSRQQQVTAHNDTNDPGSIWEVLPVRGSKSTRKGEPVLNGDIIRLRYVRGGTQSAQMLHSHSMHRAPSDGGLEVTCYEKDNDDDNWFLYADASPQTPVYFGSAVALVHCNSSAWLHATDKRYPHGTHRQREVDNLVGGSLSQRACRWIIAKEAAAAQMAASDKKQPQAPALPAQFIVSSVATALAASFDEARVTLPALVLVLEREAVFILVLDAHYQPREVLVEDKWADREVKWTAADGAQHSSTIRKALLNQPLDNLTMLAAVIQDLLRVYYHKYKYQPKTIVFLGSKASALPSEDVLRSCPGMINPVNLALKYPLEYISLASNDKARMLGTFCYSAREASLQVSADSVRVGNEVCKRKDYDTTTFFSIEHGGAHWDFVWVGNCYWTFKYGGDWYFTEHNPTGMNGEHKFKDKDGKDKTQVITPTSVRNDEGTFARIYVSLTCFRIKKTDAEWYYVWNGNKYIVVKAGGDFDVLHRESA